MNAPSRLRLLAVIPFLALACARNKDQSATASPTPAGAKAAKAPGPSSDEKRIITGFSTPESIVHEVFGDVYFVSNIAGSPTEKDDNGFISKVAPSGEILELRFIDASQEGVELNAPKGLAIAGNALVVTDLDTVRFFDRESGAPLEQVPVPGSTFLNDVVALDDSTVIVTDSGLASGPSGLEPNGTDAVYQVSRAGQVTALLKDPELGNPNGVELLGNGAIRVVTFGSGAVFDILDGKHLEYDTKSPGKLDGIVAIDERTIWVSSWESQQVARWSDGEWSAIVGEVHSPADIAVDRGRNRLLIPLFMENEVWIVPMELE